MKFRFRAGLKATLVKLRRYLMGWRALERVMRFHQILPLIAVLSICAAGAALASPGSGGAPDPASSAAPVGKALLDGNDAPIVSGRSVSARHKSRMHHVRINPDQLSDAPLAYESAPSGE
ncbi:hypothetical protein [Methylocella sp.]|jgi:hypothetical protein|uniref:hypothetical protein n=1 Tax=Methylocella sp. TaxID=1978226 RepID=UPI003C237BBD